jgi:hypothetical protein
MFRKVQTVERMQAYVDSYMESHFAADSIKASGINGRRPMQAFVDGDFTMAGESRWNRSGKNLLSNTPR